jgi:hypothetical protein
MQMKGIIRFFFIFNLSKITKKNAGLGIPEQKVRSG